MVFCCGLFFTIDDRKTVDGKDMLVRGVPDCASGRRRPIKFHAHARFLRALASEDVDSLGLRDLGRSSEHGLAALVLRSDLDDHVTVAHAGVLERDGAVVAGEDHADKGDVVTN